MKYTLSIAIDTDSLSSYTDTHLATLWHVAQANPAPHGDREAGELAEKIGREIIIRFLTQTAPELYVHQGHDYYLQQLANNCVFCGPQGCGKSTHAAGLIDQPAQEAYVNLLAHAIGRAEARDLGAAGISASPAPDSEEEFQRRLQQAQSYIDSLPEKDRALHFLFATHRPDPPVAAADPVAPPGPTSASPSPSLST